MIIGGVKIIDFWGEVITNFFVGSHNRNTQKWSNFDYVVRSIIFVIGGMLLLIIPAILFNLIKEFILFYIFVNVIRFFTGGYHSERVLEFCWIITTVNLIVAGILCKLTYGYALYINLICVVLMFGILLKTPMIKNNDKIFKNATYKVITLILFCVLEVIGIIFRNTIILNCLNWSIVMVWFTMQNVVCEYLDKICDIIFDT